MAACPVNAGHYMVTIKYCISFATDLAANFGSDLYTAESCETKFPSFCLQLSEVAVLFDSNLSRLPFLGQVVDMLCTGFNLEHADLFLCHIFTQRQMNHLEIELNNGSS